MSDDRANCCLTFKILASGLGVVSGCVAFPLFTFLYGNISAGVWAALSVLIALMVFHLHLLYRLVQSVVVSLVTGVGQGNSFLSQELPAGELAHWAQSGRHQEPRAPHPHSWSHRQSLLLLHSLCRGGGDVPHS